MSWMMNQSSEDIRILGKTNDVEKYIDVYVELQPTMKWVKGDFMSALKTRSFDQLKSSTQTPQILQCNCYSYSDSITSPTPDQKQKGIQSHEDYAENTDSERLSQQRVSSTHSENVGAQLPSLSSVSIFRPEPIFPSPVVSNSYYNKHQRMSPPDMYRGSKFYPNGDNEGSHRSDITLPMLSHMVPGYPQQQSPKISKRPEVRRSAFTIQSLSEKENREHVQTSQGIRLPSSSNASTSSIAPSNYPRSAHTVNISTEINNQSDSQNSSSNLIPVIYTTSNKKRKKIQPSLPVNNEIPVPTPPRSNDQSYQKNSHQQVNSVVRTYYEVDKDRHGSYILPVEIDSWTVVELGTVIYDRPAYHNQRYIYPINYTVRKWYRSMVDPKSDTQYTCRILENGREPKFEVTADDCPMTYSGPTPTTVWTIIVRRAFAIRNQEYGHNPVGPDFFGLRKNTIAKMIQDLPNASKCSQYLWQTFEPARFNKPGRNRRRADSTLPGSLTGGVNYGLTSSRLTHNTSLTQTQTAFRLNNASAEEAFASNNSSLRITQNPISPSLSKNYAQINTNEPSSSFSRNEKTATPRNSPMLKNGHCDSRPIETA
ncbi:hypothetical protein K501DRAFT_251497 [Backusella circina FSU 941]|nr:hypothetical protein K501DRAFT_251497 [Backusella circina FSU 941]